MARPLSEDALELAGAGWKVFPVSAVTKRPLTEHGHLDATDDVERVFAWARKFDLGGAIATPTGDGLLVIDIDPRNGGEVPRWAPTTRTAVTQSGGLHLHYAIDEDIKSRAGLFGPGVDSKCKGGYVLIPPSPGYEWAQISMDNWPEGTDRGAKPGPRAKLSKAWLERHFNEQVVHGGSTNTRRLPPEEWRRGIIHDQCVAWAAYFASVSDDEREVEQGVWEMVRRAKEHGLAIDNDRNHIGTAIEWVLERERAKGELSGPALG